MKRFSKLGAFILVLCLAIPAAAMGLQEAKSQLDTAKQQGLVGETPTGYLDVVKASGNAQGIVDTINQARRDETVAGQKALERTPSGQYILKDGQWVKK